jgi:UDP-N-acetylglucosamine diphosphorylase / glucose-1-phosphate thymidylyltransferase / UDP-N-acetylgalactosamine diphosphorylase / glucosamine-1-phosphate N-acetyltransferase / galactosamine-1-phosphate N-acetyltransferase
VIAVILAAGRGTRMGALTQTMPKPLLTLCGRPILEHIVLGLKAAGVDRMVMVTGYRGEQIEQHFGDGSRLRVALTYRRQQQPEGTARALLLARDVVGNQPLVLSWGDIVVDPENYSALVRGFDRIACEAVLTVNAVDDPWRGAAVSVDAEWRVTQLIEKPPRGASHTRWNNAGLFVFTPVIFAYAGRVQPSVRGEYELPQAIAAMIADGRSVRALPVRGFWSDLGTPDDLAAAERRYRAPVEDSGR